MTRHSAPHHPTPPVVMGNVNNVKSTPVKNLFCRRNVNNVNSVESSLALSGKYRIGLNIVNIISISPAGITSCFSQGKCLNC